MSSNSTLLPIIFGGIIFLLFLIPMVENARLKREVSTMKAKVNRLYFGNICRKPNEHVNKLRGTTSKNVEGWTLDVDYGSVLDKNFRKCRDDNSWYGYGGGRSIKTNLIGYGKARLDFGNCYDNGNVRAFLNGNEIGKATQYELSKKIEFYFNNGDTLELKEFYFASIRFNNFTVLSCFVKQKE